MDPTEVILCGEFSRMYDIPVTARGTVLCFDPIHHFISSVDTNRMMVSDFVRAEPTPPGLRGGTPDRTARARRKANVRRLQARK